MTQLVTCRSGNLSKTLLSFHHPIAAVYIYKYSTLFLSIRDKCREEEEEPPSNGMAALRAHSASLRSVPLS